MKKEPGYFYFPIRYRIIFCDDSNFRAPFTSAAKSALSALGGTVFSFCFWQLVFLKSASIIMFYFLLLLFWQKNKRDNKTYRQ
ncbi:hypothetical protein [Domibacillus indicus]|uniref:hypothetical protein n=1 Tax=Domibacillus indicus TaxID=1437523 RepID=UPI0012E092CF|nr:hypothetical protein [Domibacillus indicus]